MGHVRVGKEYRAVVVAVEKTEWMPYQAESEKLKAEEAVKKKAGKNRLGKQHGTIPGTGPHWIVLYERKY